MTQPNFNFDQERTVKTNNGLEQSAEYDIDNDIITITIKNSKKCYKEGSKKNGNWVCPINVPIRNSLKLNGNLIVFT